MSFTVYSTSNTRNKFSVAYRSQLASFFGSADLNQPWAHVRYLWGAMAEASSRKEKRAGTRMWVCGEFLLAENSNSPKYWG